MHGIWASSRHLQKAGCGFAWYFEMIKKKYVYQKCAECQCTVNQCLTTGTTGHQFHRTNSNNVSKCTDNTGKSGAQTDLEGKRNEGERKPTPGGRKKAKRKKNKCTSVPLKSHKSVGICNSGKP